MAVNSSIFWDFTPCILVKVNTHFEGTCGHHLQDLRVNQARNQNEAGRSLDEDGGDVFLRNIGVLFP
jgi:hypothetical protein